MEPTRAFRLRLREVNIPEEVLLEDLRRVAATFGNGKASGRLYDQHGSYDSATVKRRFGSWNNALDRAGLPKNNEVQIPQSRLFENIERVWVALGRQPRLVEMHKPLSEFFGSIYQRRFGSWNNALKAFLANVEEPGAPVDADLPAQPRRAPISGKRGVDLRLRFRVMQRDKFKCRMCGRSPATTPNVILHIDHVVPWSKNGLTEIDNLQTLCDRCNLGKGNLDQ